MSTDTSIDIQGCADLAKERGKELSRCRFWLRLITFALAILAAFYEFEWWHALVVLVSEAIGSVLEGLSKEWFGRHRKWRSAGLISDAFGVPISDALKNEIESKLRENDWKIIASRKRSETDPYYASKAQPGIQRLMNHVNESVHYSARLSQASHRKLMVWPIALGVFGLLLVFFAPQIEQSHWAGLSLVMTFIILISTDKVTKYFEYRKAEGEFRALEVLAKNAAQNQQVTPEALWVLADYVLVSALNPPLDSKIFQEKKQQLQSSWDSRNKA